MPEYHRAEAGTLREAALAEPAPPVEVAPHVEVVPAEPEPEPEPAPEYAYGFPDEPVCATAPAYAAAHAEPERATDEPPFWMPVEEIPRQPATGQEPGPALWPTPRMRAGRPGSVHRSVLARGRTAVPPSPRPTGPALAVLVLLSLCAAFFAWVSAEPLWLAVGHGDRGTAVITRCTGSGIGQRCVGEFRAADFTATVALLGVDDGQRRVGGTVDARMVDRDSRRAYVGDDHLALHLRWAIGLTLVLLCGGGIAWATGANRLADRGSRRRAVLGSMVGPLLLTVGFLAAAW
ncbi:MAG TPA: hypothetical protein VFT95_09430 [Micromonosporaceae bacterium]|nr:hypothetical protein [Micromonosporaceae bacterium]